MPLSQEARDEIDAILDKCEVARRKIDTQREELDDRRIAIRSPIPPRNLTQAEEDDVTRINAAIAALDDNDAEISEVMLAALNDSAAVTALGNSLRAVNTELKTKLERVERTAQQLQQVADFIKTLDGIVQNLTKLATLLA